METLELIISYYTLRRKYKLLSKLICRSWYFTVSWESHGFSCHSSEPPEEKIWVNGPQKNQASCYYNKNRPIKHTNVCSSQLQYKKSFFRAFESASTLLKIFFFIPDNQDLIFAGYDYKHFNRPGVATLSQEGIQPQGWALQYVLNDSFVIERYTALRYL